MLYSADPNVGKILNELRKLGSAANRAGMARFGINVEKAYGVSTPELRKIAKRIGTQHELAQALWGTSNHEARLLACFIDDPALVTLAQMEAWARDFDSWDVCDQATTSLFDRTPHAWKIARKWATRREEFVKRAAFSIMAGLAVHAKTAPDAKFIKLLPLIQRQASDERNFVKKAVNWALRNIGKRSTTLRLAAIVTCEKMLATSDKLAQNKAKQSEAQALRWVARDALRELTSEKVQSRLKRREVGVSAGPPRTHRR